MKIVGSVTDFLATSTFFFFFQGSSLDFTEDGGKTFDFIRNRVDPREVGWKVSENLICE